MCKRVGKEKEQVVVGWGVAGGRGQIASASEASERERIRESRQQESGWEMITKRDAM